MPSPSFGLTALALAPLPLLRCAASSKAQNGRGHVGVPIHHAELAARAAEAAGVNLLPTSPCVPWSGRCSLFFSLCLRDAGETRGRPLRPSNPAAAAAAAGRATQGREDRDRGHRKRGRDGGRRSDETQSAVPGRGWVDHCAERPLRRPALSSRPLRGTSIRLPTASILSTVCIVRTCHLLALQLLPPGPPLLPLSCPVLSSLPACCCCCPLPVTDRQPPSRQPYPHSRNKCTA
jgi:hypothetical protein